MSRPPPGPGSTAWALTIRTTFATEYVALPTLVPRRWAFIRGHVLELAAVLMLSFRMLRFVAVVP